MSRYITTIDDLRVYVDELMGREGNEPDVVRVVSRLMSDPAAPAWGDDWEAYIAEYDISVEGADE